jgi:O-antigen/teichoic acid export membrane protein
MSLLQRSAVGMFTGALSVFLKVGLNLILIPILIHLLGTQNYGLFVILVTLTETALLLDLGFSAVLTKELGASLANPEAHSSNDLLSIGQWLYGILALVSLFLAWPLSYLLPTLFHLSSVQALQAHYCFMITFVVAAIYLYNSYFRAVLLAHCLQQWNHVAHTINYVGGNALGLVAILLGYGLEGFFVGRLISALVMSLFLRGKALQAQPDLLYFNLKPNLSKLKSILAVSTSTALIQISVIISHKIDTFVLASCQSLELVGLYDIVFRTLSLVQQACQQVSQGLFPLFAHLRGSNNPQGTKNLYLSSSGLLNFIAGCSIALIVSFFPELLTFFSSGNFSFEKNWMLLLVAVPVVWGSVIQTPSTYYLLVNNHHKFLAKSSIITALSNLILSLLLVKSLGVFGVILGTLIPQSIQYHGFLIRNACKFQGISYWRYIKQIYLRMALPFIFLLSMTSLFKWCLALSHITLNLFSTGCASAVLFLATVVLSYITVLTPEERDWFDNKILKRLKNMLNRKAANA